MLTRWRILTKVCEGHSCNMSSNCKSFQTIATGFILFEGNSGFSWFTSASTLSKMYQQGGILRFIPYVPDQSDCSIAGA